MKPEPTRTRRRRWRRDDWAPVALARSLRVIEPDDGIASRALRCWRVRIVEPSTNGQVNPIEWSLGDWTAATSSLALFARAEPSGPSLAVPVFGLYVLLSSRISAAKAWTSFWVCVDILTN